jgi:hypothetical protein
MMGGLRVMHGLSSGENSLCESTHMAGTLG